MELYRAGVGRVHGDGAGTAAAIPPRARRLWRAMILALIVVAAVTVVVAAVALLAGAGGMSASC